MFVRKSTYEKLLEDYYEATENFNKLYHDNEALRLKVTLLLDAIKDIIENQTNRPNATVKRMVSIAENALKDFQ